MSQCIVPPFGGLSNVTSVSVFSASIFSIAVTSASLFVADSTATLYQFGLLSSGAVTSSASISVPNAPAGTSDYTLIVKPDNSAIYHAASAAITSCNLTSNSLTSVNACINATYPAFQVYAMAWSLDSQFLYAGLSSGDLVLYTNDVNNALSYVSTLYSIGGNESFTSLVISGDWSYVYAGSFVTPAVGRIFQWNRQLSGSITYLAAPISVGMAVYSMALDPSNSFLYVLGAFSLILFQRTSYGTIVLPAVFATPHATIVAPFGALNAMVITGESFQRSLYTCDNTGTIRAYACADSTGELSLASSIPGTACSALALSASWSTIYAVTNSSVIKNQITSYVRATPCQPGQAPSANMSCAVCAQNYYADEGASSCKPCAVGYFKVPPSRMLTNSGFDVDIVSGMGTSVSGWDGLSGTVWLVNSGYWYGMTSQSGSNFVALEFAGSMISQTVYPQGSTRYQLSFYASNYAYSAGGLTPLAVYANQNILGFITPPAGTWQQYNFQFAVPAGLSSFALQFIVGSINTGDVVVFVDTVILLSNACAQCTLFGCSGGSYLQDVPCGGPNSCLPCQAGSACAGGTAQPVLCPAYTYALASSISCSACVSNCSAGYYMVGNCSLAGSTLPATCSICPSSTYCVGGTNGPVQLLACL